MNSDLLYQLALTEVPSIGHVNAKNLVSYFGSAENIFKASFKELLCVEGIYTGQAKKIKQFRDFKSAEHELKFIQKYRIETLFINDKNYPRRLLNIYDPPTLLFYRGCTDLNISRIIAIVGTRSSTEYGKMLTDKLVQALQPYGVIIISGLAFGIDAYAHKAAIKNNIPTIGVLAHGLDIIYPPEHSTLAKSMIKSGGLLTEFKSNTSPDKYNFPSRNRIVAGMCDAVIVIESGAKGGSLITADLAHGYSRNVYAFPGKATDAKSIGCNMLIQDNKAGLLTDPQYFIKEMGWDNDKMIKHKQPKLLFEDLDEHEKKIVDLLKANPMHIDELMFLSGLSSSMTASVILALELRSIIATLPGKRLTLI
jgi:DNA processing protein